MQGNISWLRDAAERALASFIEAAAAVLITAQAFDLNALQAAGIAGLTAVLSVAKSIAARRIPGTVSPASVVTPQ